MRIRLVIANRPVPAGLPCEALAHHSPHPCLSYVDHIVSHWDDLAESTVFVPGEHLELALGQISGGRPPRVTMEIRLRAVPSGANLVVINEDIGGCPQLVLALAWKRLFASEPPPTLRIPLNPVRVTSREAICRRTRNFYLGLREDMQDPDLLPPGVVGMLWDHLFGAGMKKPGLLAGSMGVG